MEPEKKVEEKHDEKIIEAVKEEETVKKMHGGMCNKNTKMAIIVAALLIIVALGFYFRGSFIAATVNGSPISRFDVIREAEKQSGKIGRASCRERV
jgi:preprotein translocase subunit SecF